MTTTTDRTIDKVCRLGTVEIGWTSPVSLFVHIRYAAGRLSITGVEGPMRNGDARGSCGQISMHEWNFADYAPGWNAESVAKLRQVWEDWHLNDMRAGCTHQRAAKWGTTKIEVVTYKLTTEAWQLRNALEQKAIRYATENRPNDFTDTERAILGAPYELKRAPDADGPLSGWYEVAKREQKTSGWIYPSEHDQGELCKACPECGYKYGSAWLSEEVPPEVLDWLQALPDTDYKPAWA